jgi:plasmid stabilization system protein ParE
MGTQRLDLTPLPVRFWTIPKCANYVIVYRAETVPLQVVAVLHGRRNLKEILKSRPR